MNTSQGKPRSTHAPDLYQEPSEGMHYFVRKDSTSYSFKPPTPFLSTGNFDQVIQASRVKGPMNPKTFSCGNFLTSTTKEDWMSHLDFPMTRFQNYDLKHSPTNLKFCVGNEVPEHHKFTRNPVRGIPRRRSGEALEFAEASDEGEDYSHIITLSMAKPQHRSQPLEPPSIFRPPSEILQDSKHLPSTQKTPTPAHHGKSATRQVQPSGGSDSEASVNEFEMRSDEEPPSSSPPRKSTDLVSNEIKEEDEEEMPTGTPNSLGHLFSDLRNQCLNQLLNKKASKRQELSMVEDNLEAEDADYTLEELVQLSLSDKDSSIKVQSYLKMQTPEDLEYVADFLCGQVDRLALNKFGNYVVQYLIQIHEPSREVVAKVTLDNFVTYAENEYGSRIMQKLCTLSPNYCHNALRLFSKSFDRLIRNITGSILLSKLISSSQEEKDYLFALRILDSNKDYMRKAYFNRMLSTLVSCCSDQTLQEVVSIIRNHIWVLMNDKFGNYVLQVILERGQATGTSLVQAACLKNHHIIMTRKYPKFLLIKIVELEDRSGDFSSQMIKKLVELDDATLYSILEKRDSAMLMLLILSRLPPCNLSRPSERLVKVLGHQGHHLPHCSLCLSRR